jgi:hypothetical protein
VEDRDTVIRSPHDVAVTRERGRTIRRVIDPRVSVSVQEEGATLTLFFDPETALSGEAPVREIRLTPTAGGEFQPWQLLPRLPHHLHYVRGVLARRPDVASAGLDALRQMGRTRRGLSDEWLRIVAQRYESLVADDERYPIKALAAMEHADKSTASRWVSAARKRGFLRAQGSES